MYPKVKVRQEHYPEDHRNIQDSNLKASQSLLLRVSHSPARNEKDVSKQSTAKVPKCYVPHATLPRVPVSGVCNITSDSVGYNIPEKDDNIDEDKVNVRVSSIPPPRAVISSPYNDAMIGNKNRNKSERVPASKNHPVLQNRRTLCKVKSTNTAENPPNTRKSKETTKQSSNITDSVQKRRPTKVAPNQKSSLFNGRSSSIGL